MAENKLLKASDVAELLGISEDSLARWRCQGGGPVFCKLRGGRTGFIRYRVRDIEKFLEHSSRASTSDPGEAWTGA